MLQHPAGFFGGTLDSVSFSPSVRINNSSLVEVEYSLNPGRFESGEYVDENGNCPDSKTSFSDHVISSRVNYNFNIQWLISSSIQLTDTDPFVGCYFRLNNIYRLWDDCFLILYEGRRVDGPFDGQTDRTVEGKVACSLDIPKIGKIGRVGKLGLIGSRAFLQLV